MFANVREGGTGECAYVLVGMLLRAGGPDRLGRFASIECLKDCLRQIPSCHPSCRSDRTVTLWGIEEMTWPGTERNSSSVR